MRRTLDLPCLFPLLTNPAFEPCVNRVGVMLNSLAEMFYKASAAFVPLFLFIIAGSICFQLFDAPDRWLTPWTRFIGADVTEGADESSYLLATMWIYSIAVDVTVLNMMIAIMTDTYFKVARGLAIARYRMSRVGLVSEFIERAVAPQPFDILIFSLRLAIGILYAPLLTSRRVRKPAATSTDATNGSNRAGGDDRSKSPSPISATASGKEGDEDAPIQMSSWRRNIKLPFGASGFFDVDKIFDELHVRVDGVVHEETETAENHHIISRAQLEYLNVVRRRDQKDHDKEAASERVVELQDEIKRMADKSDDTTQLLLSMRLELLEQRKSTRSVQAMLQDIAHPLKDGGSGTSRSDSRASPHAHVQIHHVPDSDRANLLDAEAEEAERSQARAALREVEKAAAKDVIKEAMASARRVAKIGKWRKSAHLHFASPSTSGGGGAAGGGQWSQRTDAERRVELERQASAPVNQPEAVLAAAALGAGQPVPIRWPSEDHGVVFGRITTLGDEGAGETAAAETAAGSEQEVSAGRAESVEGASAAAEEVRIMVNGESALDRARQGQRGLSGGAPTEVELDVERAEHGAELNLPAEGVGLDANRSNDDDLRL